MSQRLLEYLSLFCAAQSACACASYGCAQFWLQALQSRQALDMLRSMELARAPTRPPLDLCLQVGWQHAFLVSISCRARQCMSAGLR